MTEQNENQEDDEQTDRHGEGSDVDGTVAEDDDPDDQTLNPA